jgi:hypothetical protein
MWLARALAALFVAGGLAVGLIFIFQGGNTAGRTRTTARVDDCHHVSSGASHSSGYEQCTGHWRFRGRVVHGDINGTTIHHLFDRVTVYANDHVAHTPHGIEWIDVVAGFAVAIASLWYWISFERKERRRRGAANPSGLSPA